ncbi:MAG: hypothetical protein A2806_00265 [Candidatus Terrybacteria bacterium RIFCSPHIGHO2_01_FULL_48_17]|uniref:SpoVR protein-like N-terminal domain-containing protein n=1 Tax=Candidatus Terrybacteria bacterium RIFCSPHIGHO2_01_FULL_48_17 TaxID=1802362 RepID=A0A1G2PJS7_9BACT|nr:MAG: hypothetical protein A2806_00265 [Candidatus Terrybacteria bacterium RIFCSPHIGHO2_01_FULL_48_17]OHA53649.1 MAG: hypothetical protein A3A30_00585 [Candidatus Terrybacteria bacterium RIFCSPLOWO2_01_FULL_48_14]
MSPEAMMVEFDAQIVPILKRLGLPSPDLDVELCETPAVVAYKAWREFPVRYPHWSSGKRLEFLEDAAKKPFLFFDIRGVPGRMTWLPISRSRALACFTWLHTRIHHAFTESNIAYQNAFLRITPEQVRDHARCVRALVNQYGLDVIEHTISSAHKVRRQWGLDVAPEGGILSILKDPALNPRMPSWRRDILQMVEDEWPLIAADEYLSLCDEGFTMWAQMKVLHELIFPAENAVDISRIIAQLLMLPQNPMVGIRPHLVGFWMFASVEARFGSAECLAVAQNCLDDSDFVRAYLTQDVAEQCGLGTASGTKISRGNLVVNELPDDPQEFQIIKEVLAQNIGRERHPKIRILGVDGDGTLSLEHIFEGKYLNQRIAMDHIVPDIADLWGNPVTLRFRDLQKAPQRQGEPIRGWIEVEETADPATGDIVRKTLGDFHPFTQDQPRLPGM